MKTTINKQELIELDACKSGFETFVGAHCDNAASFSECLKSNGIDDVLWMLSKINNELSEVQHNDLHLLACDYAESVLHLFENDYPKDKRPRLAIQAKRDFVAGMITPEELDAVRAAAWAAAWAAAGDVARAAAWAAAWAAAGDAARDAAGYAAWAVAGDAQTEMLMAVLLKWEEKR